jgi:hypothetical protein
VKRLLSILALPLLAVGAAVSSQCLPPDEQSWRPVATSDDRGRVREWRTAFTRGLAAARQAGHAEDIALEGALLEPDAALLEVTPPPGDYRCRVTKLGAQGSGLLAFVAYPAFNCRISANAEGLTFAKLDGSQRPIGHLYPESERRMVFLGTLQLGDERGVHPYGRDKDRDMAGLLERVSEQRWRILFPNPRFESFVDVMELIPRN